MDHHTVFNKFRCWEGKCSLRFEVNCLGVMTRKEFLFTGPTKELPKQDFFKEKIVRTQYPAFDEGYFEYISVLEAVITAQDEFTMLELGAGIGPHLLNAAKAIHFYHKEGFPYKLIGVEGEPTCYKWLEEHFRDNNIDPENHRLIEAVVAPKDGKVLFDVGFPRGYGSFIVSPVRYISYPLRWFYRFLKRVYKKCKGRPCVESDYWRGNRGLGIYTKKIRAISLGTLLSDLDSVDLIHFDIYGAELPVIKTSKTQLNKKVKKVHIGTHSRHIEKELRKIFSAWGWKCLFDYPGRGERNTLYGKIKFADGVQVWINESYKR